MKTVELAEGITAHVADDVSTATITALRGMAYQLRHREIHGWLSNPPVAFADNYENVDVKCALCGAFMPHAPWPKDSNIGLNWKYRPRCGKCNSMMTYPVKRKVTA